LAVALEAGGRAGQLGGLLDLYFQPEWSLQLGYGGTRATQQVSAGVRSFSSGGGITPTLVAGALLITSRPNGDWTEDEVSPSELWTRILTEKERREQVFQLPLIHLGIGFEWLAVGRFAKATIGEGPSLSGEILYIIRPSQLVGFPALSVAIRHHL
jgi:hypothetical protein